MTLRGRYNPPVNIDVLNAKIEHGKLEDIVADAVAVDDHDGRYYTEAEIDAQSLDYSLIDGTRAFTGVVGGIAPTASSHLVTKEYVDFAVAGLEFDMFLDDLDSTINDPGTANDYYSLQTTQTGDATTTRDAYAALGQGDDQEVVSYISSAALPFAQLQIGVVDFHVHARKNNSGQKIATIFGKLYHRTSGATETLIATTEQSAALGITVADYSLHGNITSVVDFSATDRLVLKIRANVQAAGGGNAEIEITQEGNEDSFVSALVVTDTLSNIFLRQDGTKELTANWGVGGFDITGIGTITSGAITSSGASTFNSGSVDADFTVNWNTGTGLFVQGSDGRVGIGTTSPGALLEIQSSNAILRLRDTGATADATLAYVEFGGTDAAAWSRTGFVGDGSSGNTDIYLVAEISDLHLGDSSGFNVMNLQGGNVGIGLTTVNANYKLIIRRAADINLGIGLQSSELAIAAFNDALSANIPLRFYASEYNLLNGNVGINTTTPVSKLSINGGLHVGGDSDAGDNNLLVDGTANVDSLAAKTVSITPVSNEFKFLNAGNRLGLQGVDGEMILRVYSKLGNRTQNVNLNLYGYGDPASNTNRERLNTGWNAAAQEFQINVNIGGDGIAKKLNIYTHGNSGQLELATNGDIYFRTGNLFIPSDDKYIAFGVGSSDLRLYSDGTRGIITVNTSLRLGSAATNYTEIGAAGDLSFVGSAGFYPRFLTQANEPAAGTGATQLDTSEMCIWKDSDDNKIYFCFNDGGTVKTAEAV